MKAFSIFLLFCFSIVHVPKNWWPYCGHADHKKSTQSQKHTIEDDCPVCDLSLSVFTRPTAFLLRLVKQVPVIRIELNYTGLSQTKFKLFQLRAPPAMLML